MMIMGIQVTAIMQQLVVMKSEDLMFFIDSCHSVGLKVIMDWVPAHFPKTLTL